MPVETFNFIDSLNASNPGSTDDVLQGDDHLRGVKAVLKNTFPNVTAAITATAAQLNQLASGVIGYADAGWNFLSETSLGIQRSASGVMSIVGGKLIGNGAVPTGMLADFLTGSQPTGWYEVNGQAIPRTGATAGLFAICGTTYGVGDGVTTFNLPNLNDYFRRSRGTNTLGAFMADAVKQHQHGGTTDAPSLGVNITDLGHAHTMNPAGAIYAATATATMASGVAGGGNPAQSVLINQTQIIGTQSHTADITATVTGQAALGLTTDTGTGLATETRPKTFVVATFVKA